LDARPPDRVGEIAHQPLDSVATDAATCCSSQRHYYPWAVDRY